MFNKILCFLLVGLLHFNVAAQTDSLYVVVDTTAVEIAVNEITNKKALHPLFEKINRIQADKSGKINIVHIGDSHIQADFFSGKFRQNLQQQFGDGGRGFVFPYNLAKTNGPGDIRFSSNEAWESQRNIYADNGNPVGLSGIALWTKNKDFALEMNVKTKESGFSKLKIFTPNNQKMFDVALASKIIQLESDIPKKIVHKIRNGESLSVIADKYNVTIKSIKSANSLKSNNIRAGKTLKIPSNQMEKKVVERSEFIPIETLREEGFHSFASDSLLHKIYLIPALEQTDFALNGLVLENNSPGIIYHTIGVNGAKSSDYNKFPLFFEQLKTLTPDLVIISLGTNESFDKLVTADYFLQLSLMMETIVNQNPSVTILITTPPPSQFKRKFPNTFVADYTKEILAQAELRNYAVWDMFAHFGGLFGINQMVKEGLIGADRVHYTKAGYEKQGQLLTDAFLEALQNYNTETGK
ncbi:LysM peptidoglycan-binding domain-containing protein [Flavobacterium piscinae]|uniref:LysM peptidoglycan-binding domain-containing protein n=1 Tax=Flavobacterium piscinae TaxID=2506424 RepID=A0A4Q1KU80_9FLAO|nr:LysM peptidoglycan-binding domain-containing protein [Flavobacterium piscinae]RXR32959.1 LysM peptidoglycan-binding domain-containing protein [Flavobacterium piscinae]